MRIGPTFFIILIIKVAAHGGGGAKRGDGGRAVRAPRTLVGWSNPGGPGSHNPEAIKKFRFNHLFACGGVDLCL